MKYFILQTVQLKGSGIPGVICDRTPSLKIKNREIAEPAYEVQWVDGTESIHMESELGAITGLSLSVEE